MIIFIFLSFITFKYFYLSKHEVAFHVFFSKKNKLLVKIILIINEEKNFVNLKYINKIKKMIDNFLKIKNNTK